MLIRFAVSNFRSILDPVELSMVAIDRDRPAARSVDNLGESLLPVAAIYGPNASGKSNILAALTWLVSGIESSHRYWDDEIPVDPFAFSDGQNRMTEFTIDAIIQGIRFEYTVTLDRDAIQEEALFHYPEKKRKRIFERVGSELKLQRGLGNLSGIRALLSPRALALSVARRFDDPLVSEFSYRLLNAQTRGTSELVMMRANRHTSALRYSTTRLFDNRSNRNQPEIPGLETPGNSKFRSQALALLKLADLGIDDVIVDEQDPSYSDTRSSRRRTRLIHRVGDERFPLDFSQESSGTLTWYRLIGPTLGALRNGTLLLFDELDANLHPTLCMELIRLFQDPVTNPKGAQLIFSSHDTSLLNHLNRDEVWLTEKGSDGATRLGALADFAGERVRRSQNLEKAYLHGRFGALPEVDRAEFLRALGLIG